MFLKILSQVKPIFEADVLSFTANSLSGEVTILSNHENIHCLLDVGEVRVQQDKENHSIAINGGVLIIEDGSATILATEAIPAKELVREEIEKALKDAQDSKASDLLSSELIQIEKEIRYEKLKKKLRDKLG